MAMAGDLAALAAAQSPTSGWPERRRRRRAAVGACTGRLEAALARVRELEAQVAALKAAAQQPEAQVLDEMASRLKLVAPVISNGIQAAEGECVLTNPIGAASGKAECGDPLLHAHRCQHRTHGQVEPQRLAAGEETTREEQATVATRQTARSSRPGGRRLQ